MRHGQLMKSQSAMEYLMTYGWAILIIAVVLGALFQLGVFSGIGTPKAQSGNCQVVKVGSGITQTISLAGQCQGQEPEFVGVFSLNPHHTYPNITAYPEWNNGINITETAWIYPLSSADTGGDLTGGIVTPMDSNTQTYEGNLRPPTLYVNPCGGQWVGDDYLQWMVSNTARSVWWANKGNTAQGCLAPNQWYFVAGTVNQQTGVITDYVDAQEVENVAFSGIDVGAYTVLIGTNPGGLCCGANTIFNGYLANIQIYNASLSQTELTSLYDEGIGGAPLMPQNIMGWWPLNGNAKDYSGNNNNGQIYGIKFTGSWTSGYTKP